MKRENINIVWYEIALVLLTLFTIARFIWAEELRELEVKFLMSFGFTKFQIYSFFWFLTIFVGIKSFKKEMKLANDMGKPIVRKSFLMITGIIIILIILFLINLV